MLRKLLTAALLLGLAGALPAARAQSPDAQAAAKAEKERLAREAKIRAEARSWRCVAKDGRKYYGATRPPQCMDVAAEALSAQGTVIGRIEAPLTPEQRAARDAAAKENAAAEAARREAERAAMVQARRDQALLQTYANEHDIEMVRQRAIADNERASAQVAARIAALKRRQEALGKEAAAIKAGGKQRDNFEQDVKAVAYDLELQQQLLESRKHEAAAINARYEEEKRKYRELTQAAARK